MPRRLRRRTLLATLIALLAAGAVTVALTAALADDHDGPARGHAAAATAGGAPRPCGAATAGTLAAVQTTVAERIYGGELHGTETRQDQARVSSYAPLLAALQDGSRAQVAEAVAALVYKPHWHIVRLRVLRGDSVLGDVGGPDVLAPVSGTLRAHGRTLGRYVLSVQDDLGYLKLVTRFLADPLDLYRGSSLVMGSGPRARAANGTTVRLGGASYLVRDIALGAFPSGPLQAVLFVPAAPRRESCAAVTLAAWGSVARHVEARLAPIASHYEDLASVLRTVSGGQVFVRAGSRRLVAGGPRRLPDSGTVRWAGRRWPVYSWQPAAGVRAYFLTPAA